jgi:hypothetical protein
MAADERAAQHGGVALACCWEVVADSGDGVKLGVVGCRGGDAVRRGSRDTRREEEKVEQCLGLSGNWHIVGEVLGSGEENAGTVCLYGSRLRVNILSDAQRFS